jgi:hypothetical protein
LDTKLKDVIAVRDGMAFCRIEFSRFFLSEGHIKHVAVFLNLPSPFQLLSPIDLPVKAMPTGEDKQ